MVPMQLPSISSCNPLLFGTSIVRNVCQMAAVVVHLNCSSGWPPLEGADDYFCGL